MAVDIDQDGACMRICPRCGGIFDGAHIGATADARILCGGCTLWTLEHRRRSEAEGRYWWQAKEPTDGR